MNGNSVPIELLAPITESDRSIGNLQPARVSRRGEAAKRFVRNKTAVPSLVFIAALAVMAILVPMLYPTGYNDQNLKNANLPIVLKVLIDGNGDAFYSNSDQKVWILRYGGAFITPMQKTKDDDAKRQMLFAVDGKSVILDYNNKKLTLLQADGTPFTRSEHLWNARNILGTDSLGRDLFIRVAYGARISLLIALIATLVNLIIGVLYGCIAGYIGGTVDNALMRIVDIISTVPLMLYVILIMVTLGAGLASIILSIGLVFWVDMARIVRGQVKSLKNNDYIAAARTIGTGTGGIVLRHILPNTADTILVTLILNIPKAIFIEAFLSYIGLGVPVPFASWGTLCSNAVDVLNVFPYQLIVPSLAICLTMFAFNFFGDGLRDAFSAQER